MSALLLGLCVAVPLVIAHIAISFIRKPDETLRRMPYDDIFNP